MATSIDNREQQQQMSNSSGRLLYHVSFNDDQRPAAVPTTQQHRDSSNINLDDLSSGSRQGLSRKIFLMLIIQVMERNELLIVDYSFAWISRLLIDRKMSD